MGLFLKIWQSLFGYNDVIENDDPPVVDTVQSVVPSPEDPRDEAYAFGTAITYDAASLPEKPEGLYKYKGRNERQHRTNMCFSFSACLLGEVLYRQKYPAWSSLQLSQRFSYYKVRTSPYVKDFPELAYPNDNGQHARSGLKCFKRYGVCPDSVCPTGVTSIQIKENINKPPSKLAESMAKWWKIKSYHRCYTYDDIRAAIAANLPVLVCLRTYSGYNRPTEWKLKDVYRGKQSKIKVWQIPLPQPGEKLGGGHAVCALDYDEEGIILHNSWGRDEQLPPAFFTCDAFIEAWAGSQLELVEDQL